MINGIGASGSGLIGGQTGLGQTARAGGAAAPGATPAEHGPATTIHRLAAEGAPIAQDRVAALRAAIRGGTYKADAGQIADKMIASDLGGVAS
ncbi:flagellar biosynthesis anti-sigma factor FlgM [Sphingomonas morindae]|uniref:Negative regulator of flagellin synthesis n=1 Tax=Sphingomonas morindae TaxID=1541170 RepID=A0ABY4X9W6_9SPHN|nr:flagellar biosynthesis anti-sigma factor FlgM [Sphingomonas morindae]USI73732.1 flagellar biosynthesis anti-sigma factor FlgM [Sphingomonas morindae]